MNADYWWKGPDWIDNDLKEELASAKILTTCTVEADSVLNSIPLVVKSNPLEPIITTKAVHLELVSTLSTDAMLAALRRFIARRGHPSEIHSDNGTNFIGANNYLKQLYMLVKEHSIQKWKSLLKLRQHFWDRWHKEVLHHYQSRPKWKASQSEVQVGNLVLISDDNRPHLSWPMARILKLIPGTDGTNRVAILQTGSGLTRRSINKIVVLPICAREDGDSEMHH
ncbi:DUF5641 domain-containing protein [Trichonephila clavipes]|nr:DUF5641 domain-containing protein [Trichonephila clavipes]